MRKRSQRKSRTMIEEPKHIVQKPSIEIKPSKIKKNWWITVSLIAIFFLVLTLNAYFNASSGVSINNSGEGLDKYYLSGPDPYYNMRIVEQTLYGEEAGIYPFYSVEDPLLNYPLGRTGHRAPLLNMLAIGFSSFLTPFMGEIDAVGYSMQFIPALFGALLIFPVYFIGNTLFGKKAGLLAALFIAIIPIHLGSGHGSAYSLFDHDSFNLLMYVLTFLFIIWGIKEKNTFKSTLYGLLAGIPLGALSMTWVEAQYLYVIVGGYAIIQMIIDIFTSKIDIRVFRTTSIALFTGYFVSLPVLIFRYGGFTIDISLFICLAVFVFGILYYLFNVRKLPWTLSLPTIFSIGAVGLVFLYFIRDISYSIPILSSLRQLSEIIFGSGIYGNKVSMTIAEAGTYEISRTVMSFGPALYWLSWLGTVFLCYKFYKNHQRRDFLFIIVLFLIQMWLTGVAGRFLNDLVPVIAILGAWIVWIVVDKINYKQMIKTIRAAGGGFHGIRKGMSILHIFGIVFIGLFVIFPNTYLAFDAAVPLNEKENVFGDLPSGAFGLSHGKEAYWVDAYSWLKEQDTNISNPVDRPAFISWWDYGFYEVAVGDHPAVADNFQDGIPPAANFHTATSEEEAVAVWIVRLLEGNAKDGDGKISNNVFSVIVKHLGQNESEDIKEWVENPKSSPSYNKPIGTEYNEELGEEYPVGQQWPMNAVYHDVSDLILKNLDDEGITNLYVDLQEATGYSIRYYGVEGYDKQIFNIFGFLADKSLILVSGGGVYNPEDDFVYIKYVTQNNNELTFDELQNLSDAELRNDPPVNTKPYYKDAYFNTMFYKTYVGISQGESGSKSEPDYQLPCSDMKHFYAEYISNISKYAYYSGKSAVVVAKYYAGAFVNGSVFYDGDLIDTQIVVQKNITHYGMEIPLDHDSNSTVNGSFSVIVPAGEITLQVRRYPELGINGFPMKNVTFNGMGDFSPISDDEAMRRTEEYYRLINVTIDPANLKGYIYDNLDNNSGYNVSADNPIPNAELIVWGINSFDSSTGQPSEYDFNFFKELSSDDDGYYNTSNLKPGYYRVIATVDDFVISDTIIPLYEGNSTHNISKPKEGNIEGTIYFDSNKNGEYDVGEEVEGSDISLKYTTLYGDIKTVESLITDSSGSYSFKNIIPGGYTIEALKLPDYEISTNVTVNENKTDIYNISLDYSKIVVSGVTRDNNTLDIVSNITIILNPDETIENNTAVFSTIQSDVNGEYSQEIYPGSYNVSVDELMNVSGVNVTYTFEGKMELPAGSSVKTYDILLVAKEES